MHARKKNRPVLYEEASRVAWKILVRRGFIDSNKVYGPQKLVNILSEGLDKHLKARLDHEFWYSLGHRRNKNPSLEKFQSLLVKELRRVNGPLTDARQVLDGLSVKLRHYWHTPQNELRVLREHWCDIGIELLCLEKSVLAYPETEFQAEYLKAICDFRGMIHCFSVPSTERIFLEQQLIDIAVTLFEKISHHIDSNSRVGEALGRFWHNSKGGPCVAQWSEMPMQGQRVVPASASDCAIRALRQSAHSFLSASELAQSADEKHRLLLESAVQSGAELRWHTRSSKIRTMEPSEALWRKLLGPEREAHYDSIQERFKAVDTYHFLLVGNPRRAMDIQSAVVDRMTDRLGAGHHVTAANMALLYLVQKQVKRFTPSQRLLNDCLNIHYEHPIKRSDTTDWQIFRKLVSEDV